MLCKDCEQKLLRVDANSNFYAYVCDNWQCDLYAHPQAYEPKNPGALPKVTSRYYARVAPGNTNLVSTSNRQMRLALGLRTNE